MNKIQLNVTREEVLGYEKQKIEALTEDFGWVVKFSSNQITELKSRLIEKIEKHKEWKHILSETIFLKMKPKMPKIEHFNPSMVSCAAEALELIIEQMIKLMELDKIKIKQKTINETMKEDLKK